MLDSLHVKNFKNLKDFKINSLGRINLFTGKNNTGKTSILEAIYIYATQGFTGAIYDILNDRDEDLPNNNPTIDYTDVNVRAFASLFTDRITSFEKEGAFTIKEVGESSEKFTSIRFVKFVLEESPLIEGADPFFRRIKLIPDNEPDSNYIGFKLGLEIKTSKKYFIVRLEKVVDYSTFDDLRAKESEAIQYVRTQYILNEDNGKLWDKIALTEKEQYVVDALKIIEPLTERIGFFGDKLDERIAKVKLANNPAVLPLQSMGDGINRILTIILAMVNAENGYLLIDEFENGLHYTVQEKLWTIIFQLAEKLNVQVFATTHSSDGIVGFEEALNSKENKLSGKLIRLDNVNGKIEQVEFDAKELAYADVHNIEIR